MKFDSLHDNRNITGNVMALNLKQRHSPFENFRCISLNGKSVCTFKSKSKNDAECSNKPLKSNIGRKKLRFSKPTCDTFANPFFAYLSSISFSAVIPFNSYTVYYEPKLKLQLHVIVQQVTLHVVIKFRTTHAQQFEQCPTNLFIYFPRHDLPESITVPKPLIVNHHVCRTFGHRLKCCYLTLKMF